MTITSSIRVIAAATSCLLGACINEENLGNSQRAPIPYTTLTTGPAGDAYQVQVDDTYVYWSAEAPDTTTLYRVPKTGGTAEAVAQVPMMWAFVLAGDYAYATRNNDDVVRISTATGAIDSLVDLSFENSTILAVVDSWVYVSEVPDGPEWIPATWRVPTTGGAREDLDTAPAESPGRIFVGVPKALSWLGSDRGVWTMPTGGGAATRVVDSIGDHGDDTTLVASNIVANADNLFIASNAPRPTDPGGPPDYDHPFSLSVVQYNFDAGSMLELGHNDATTYLQQSRGIPTGLVGVEWILEVPAGSETTNAITYYPSDGSGRRSIYDDVPQNWVLTPDFEPDGSAMYWVDADTGDVNRVDLDLTGSLQ
jgi:hypothetical protein